MSDLYVIVWDVCVIWTIINGALNIIYITELETAYDVFKNKQGKIMTSDLPLVSSSLGISLDDAEIEMVVKDATG